MDHSRLGALRDILGPDRQIAAITRTEMRDYVGKLMKLPANAGQRFKGLSALEAIAAGEGKGADVLSSKSVKLYCDAARSLFAWLEREELITQNPAKQLASPKVPATKNRRNFTGVELVALLNATSVRARGGRDWAYWCTRINLLQGFRLTEPLGLLAEDLVTVDGVLVFRLRDNEHRRLKRDTSTRDVPVHPKLIELGITDLLVGKNAEDRLLSDAPKGKGKAFNAAQKQISRLIDKHVSTDRKLTFHSLRHGFRDEARRRSIPRDVVERLGGWSASDKSAMDGYGEGYGLDDLLLWLSTMTFDGLMID
jgi:integrase